MISIEAARALWALSVSNWKVAWILLSIVKLYEGRLRSQASPRNQFRLVLSDAGALIIETPLRVLKLTLPQTDALRSFLLAIDPE